MTLQSEAKRTTGYRRDRLWQAAMVHRVSGLLLALFLPLHFLALGLAIEGEARLGQFLGWSQQPVVRLAEAVLVTLLTVHLLGGVRVLVIENLRWRDEQKTVAMAALVGAAVAGLAFLALHLF